MDTDFQEVTHFGALPRQTGRGICGNPLLSASICVHLRFNTLFFVLKWTVLGVSPNATKISFVSATDLNPGASSIEVAAVPVTIGDRKVVTEVLAEPRKFNRLRKP